MSNGKRQNTHQRWPPAVNVKLNVKIERQSKRQIKIKGGRRR